MVNDGQYQWLMMVNIWLIYGGFYGWYMEGYSNFIKKMIYGGSQMLSYNGICQISTLGDFSIYMYIHTVCIYIYTHIF